ncbi:hypothetical protein [Nesterenkonia pannonica]|uniref:hypothetical protein n=1 Tax=Nesterenkonia pannonica TaxID=1548602 RepID=UPI0021643BE5|nr:hypothetical protein [Nesterenkonia pannonica]
MAGLVLAGLSFSMQGMGFAPVNQHMQQSTVLRALEDAVPDPVERMFGQLQEPSWTPTSQSWPSCSCPRRRRPRS